MENLGSNGRETLIRLVSQIESLDSEKQGIAEDIRDKFAEAKSFGFDVKILRQVLRLRKKSKTDRDEEEAVLNTYLHALEGTPLGNWAAENRSAAN